MAGAADGDGDAFSLDGADVRGGELAEGVGPDEDSVAGVDDATFDNAGYNCADERDGKGVIDVEFEGGFGVVIPVVREYVEEGPDKVEGFARDVRDLEDRADALTDKLGGGLDGVFPGFDEDWDFAGAGRFEYAGELGDGLLEDLGWTDVDFSDYYHYRNIQSKGNA